MRIFTGAPMPTGADTILIQENANVSSDNSIEAIETVAAGRHIRTMGLDFNEGDALLEKGRVLDAAALSLAASANHPRLPCVKNAARRHYRDGRRTAASGQRTRA